MVDLKEHSICVKFCFKLRKTASETHEMLKTAFSDNAVGRKHSIQTRVTSVEHQEHASDLFWLWGHCSPGICSSRPDGEPASLPSGFEASEGASPPKTSGTMAEPGLVASSAQRFLAAYKHVCGPTTPPPLFVWFGPCDFFLFPR
jgi:hypothetical protein